MKRNEWREEPWNIYITTCKTDGQWEALTWQGLKRMLCDNLDGLGSGREGTRVNLGLIHVEVWQKPTHYSKAITLQLKTS